MKRFAAILLALVMVFTIVSVTACKLTKTVTVTLYPTEDGIPMRRNHVVGTDDLTQHAGTNGNLVFGGWYYDKLLTDKFNPDNDKTENGTSLYGKWSLPTQDDDKKDDDNDNKGNKVTLTFNYNYAGVSSNSIQLDKNSTFVMPPAQRDGYTFNGWWTLPNGGFQWTSTTPISADITLYAHWTQNSQGGETPTPVDLSSVLSKYADTSTWCFADTVTVSSSQGSYDDYYEYYGDLVLNRYVGDDNNTYTDYYDMSDNNVWYAYGDNGDGTYSKYADTTDEDNFYDLYGYTAIIDLYTIANYTFAASGSGYAAQNPSDAGNAVLGEYDGYTWNSFTIYITNGNITKIVAALSSGTTYTHVLSKYGQVVFTLPDVSGGTTPVDPTGTMDKQVYNSATFKNQILQDKLTTGTYGDPYIGLPSKGEYTALVIPVKFSDTTISQKQLDNLNIAFNDTTGQTGWESVKSYYYKASYGALDLSFDIAGANMAGINYYISSNSSTYYANQTETYQGQEYTVGDNVLLHEVLAYYEDKLDLTKYDHNKDGAIDAVYLIYSAPVDYVDDDQDFYWAYVTWDDDGYDDNDSSGYNPQKYDNVDVYYYLFAGLGFMEESVKGGYVTEYYPEIEGLKINASTYIHETGHLLGLDDYYDYEESLGCNEGLGGADMMDATVGDQNVFSKLMLGWLTPTIVTDTQTITIKSSQERGDAILIPLNFDNSYFCEYLLIDLYSNQGLNALHASMENSYLYDGATYGVRIYHVTAWANDPYNNSYQSFNDYNNSTTNFALIKLVEADGEKKFASTDGWAAESDLWQTGDKLSTAFPQYMTNAGKLLIFDITMNSVTQNEATITITYNAD